MYYTFYFLQSETPQRFQIKADGLAYLVRSDLQLVVVDYRPMLDYELPLLSVDLPKNLTI